MVITLIEDVVIVAYGVKLAPSLSAVGLLGYVGREYVLRRGIRGLCFHLSVFSVKGSSIGYSSVSFCSSGFAVWVAGSGSGKCPVTISASQSASPPGAASTAVWGLYT